MRTLLLLALGCPPDLTDTAGNDSREPIPAGTRPCEHPEYWPYQVQDEAGRFTVHHRTAAEADMAAEVAAILAVSFDVEVDGLGFRRPLADAGLCGEDAGFDVFLWHGIDTCYADVFADNPETWYDDWFSYVVVDPWGPYGGEMLDSTLAHELNHACQASDDWWDAPVVFEMTSALVEEVVFDDDDTYVTYFADFQARPDWSFDRDDGYATWFGYGASMYLFFLRDRYFDGDASFAADMWLGLRSEPGAADDPALNEPDFEDALEVLLQDRAGVSFLDSAVEFARWRWYTGSRDDGRHFEEGALWPEDALIVPETLAAGDSANPRPMVLGNAYYELTGEPDGALVVEVEAPGEVALAIQALPGLDGSDGEALGDGPGRYEVTLGADGTRALVVTVLPTWAHDPDTREDTRYALQLAALPVEEPPPPR